MTSRTRRQQTAFHASMAQLSVFRDTSSNYGCTTKLKLQSPNYLINQEMIGTVGTAVAANKLDRVSSLADNTSRNSPSCFFWHGCQALKELQSTLGIKCNFEVPYLGLFNKSRDNRACWNRGRRKRQNRVFRLTSFAGVCFARQISKRDVRIIGE